MSEDGQICRTMAQAALEMQFPCIQITPGFTRDLEEWAKMIYMISEMAKRIEDKIKIALPVNVVNRENVECESSPNGLHEMMEINKDGFHGALVCIHCGKTLIKTSKNKEELSIHFKEKKFNMTNHNLKDLPF